MDMKFNAYQSEICANQIRTIRGPLESLLMMFIFMHNQPWILESIEQGMSRLQNQLPDGSFPYVFGWLGYQLES